ncbi:MAG: glycosyltransferase [Bacteroidetes bacterium]|nr:glycosyltransferase [Bacteroidota bacterium]
MQRNRKIVIVGPAYPLRGGLAAYNERLARAYQLQGDEVIIYTFTLQYPDFLFPGKTQYSTDKAPDDLTIRVKVNSINPLNWWSTGKEIKKLKPDLLIIKFWIPFMAPCLGTIARIVRKNKGTKVISIIDNIIPHEKRPGDHTLANFWVKSVDGFVAMSKSVLTDLDTFDQKRPKLFCPHPLYDNFGKPISKTEAQKLLGINSGKKYILFFGFIRDYKGLDILLKAMADKEIRNNGIRLIVAGEFYTDSKKYMDIIKEENLGDHVILATDFIPDKEVYQYFSAVDLVVQPYKDATQSGVTQIAYHFNKPMITTDVGGLAEIIPDGKVGYVVKPGVREIRDAILRFYDLNKEDEFIEAVKIEKAKYTWENMLHTIDKLIES